ncbi:Serine hydrolase, partial [Globisporangium splendens]
MTDKLRVLCLHGYGQDGETLRGRIAAFRRAFKSSAEFVCIDGPLLSEPRDKDDSASTEQEDAPAQSQGHSWFQFQRNEDGEGYTLSHVDETIAYIGAVCREQGPFDGILGFSQGGTTASLVLQNQRALPLLLYEKPEDSPFVFKFGIFISAPQPGDPCVGNPALKLAMPTLHVIGETDTVIEPARSRKVAEGFVDPHIFMHPGGHYIPTNKEPKDAFRDFFKQLKELQAKAQRMTI